MPRTEWNECYDILIPASKEGKLVVPPAQKGTCFSQKPEESF